jgi:uncharacterized protein (DUF427 family)
MAIDTDAKRFSAMNVMCPWRGIAALPSGTVDGAARQALRWLYSGIAATSEVISLVFSPRFHRRRLTTR